jgi:hypothetical protein
MSRKKYYEAEGYGETIYRQLSAVPQRYSIAGSIAPTLLFFVVMRH